MSYSSPRKRIIKSPSTLLDAGKPLDSFSARDVVFNNLLHHADQSCARALVNFTAANVTAKNLYISGLDASGSWGLVEQFGPFPLSAMQRDGVIRAYPLRVALNAGTDGTSHSYAVQISAEPFSRPVASGLVADGGDTCTFNATTGASGWLTATVDDIILPQAPLTSPRSVPTLTEPGGDAVNVLCYMAFVRVLCIGSSPRLYGMHVAEVYQ